MNVYRKRGSKSQLRVENGELVKLFSVLDKWKDYIRLYGTGEFFPKNCKMIRPKNSALKSIQHSKNLMQFLLQKYWNQIGITLTPYFKGKKEEKNSIPISSIIVGAPLSFLKEGDWPYQKSQERREWKDCWRIGGTLEGGRGDSVEKGGCC